MKPREWKIEWIWLYPGQWQILPAIFIDHHYKEIIWGIEFSWLKWGVGFWLEGEIE